MESDAVVRMRAGQRRLFRLVDRYRLLGFIARRQYGKTTTCANIALMKMMKRRDHTVIFGSAKLNLSREIVRKEASVLERAISAATAKVEAGRLRLADDRQSPKGVFLLEGGVDGEGDDLVRAVEGEILVGEIGRLPRPEDDDAIGLRHEGIPVFAMTPPTVFAARIFACGRTTANCQTFVPAPMDDDWTSERGWMKGWVVMSSASLISRNTRLSSAVLGIRQGRQGGFSNAARLSDG